MVEALADGAVKAGLSRSMALTLAIKTMMGTAKILLDQHQPLHPSQLKDAVASPGRIDVNPIELSEYFDPIEGGTTIYGLEMMEKAGVRAALMETVTSATRRAMELES
jgi:pyrroline-5-carboxylate reductase